MTLQEIKLATIALGYVGLLLGVEFGKQRSVIDFDINQKRIDQLKTGHYFTLETETEELQAAKNLQFSTSLDDLRTCNVYIVTVPRPIAEHKRPDPTPLIKASETVLEKFSALKFNQDFYCGYNLSEGITRWVAWYRHYCKQQS